MGHNSFLVFLCLITLSKGCSFVYDSGDLSGYMDSNEGEEECYWRVNPGHPWTSVRLRFISFTSSKLNDFLEIYQIENEEEVLITRATGNAEFSGFTSGLGNGILLKKKTTGVSFRAEFQRFSGGMWSEVDENSIEAFCDSLDFPHIFHEKSCYSVHKKSVTFAKAFAEGCGTHGHLALVNDVPTINAISQEHVGHWENLNNGFVGLEQLDNSDEYEPDRGWYYKLPNGKKWNVDDVIWNTHADVGRFQPDDDMGNEDCGTLHFNKQPYSGGLNDAPCDVTNYYHCEYESMCTCPAVLYTATETRQFMQSPNYPKHYCPDMVCYYIIRAEDKNHRIKLMLEVLELGDYEWLEIFEDSTNTLEPNNVIKTWEGGSLPSNGKILTSETNSVLIQFRSFQGYRKGFRIAYEQDVGASKKSLQVDDIHEDGTSGSSLKPAIIALTCFIAVCILIIVALWYRRKRQRQRDLLHYSLNVEEDL